MTLQYAHSVGNAPLPETLSSFSIASSPPSQINHTTHFCCVPLCTVTFGCFAMLICHTLRLNTCRDTSITPCIMNSACSCSLVVVSGIHCCMPMLSDRTAALGVPFQNPETHRADHHGGLVQRCQGGAGSALVLGGGGVRRTRIRSDVLSRILASHIQPIGKWIHPRCRNSIAQTVVMLPALW